MSLLELFFIAVGVSMDAFAVAVCAGLSMRKSSWAKAGIVGLYFGVFQAGMPFIGYVIGSQFADKITFLDHWIAFLLLAFIGGKMIKGALTKEDTVMQEVSLGFQKMLPLAVATSIDALAIGVSFAFLQVQIVPAVVFIGVTTLLLSMAGVKIGNTFGEKYKAKAELVGGIILVLIGVKILLEHTGLLG